MYKLLVGAMLAGSLVGAPALAAPANAGSFMIASADGLLAKAKSERKAGRYSAAEATLEQAIAKDPGYESYLAMGSLKDYLGAYDDALSFYKKALAAKEGDPDAQVLIAHAQLMLDKYDATKALCEKLERDASFKEASTWARSELHTDLGGALGLKSQREGLFAMLRYGLGVRNEFEKAVEIDPDNARARFALGRYFLEAPGAVGGSPSKGTEMLAKAVKMDSEDWVIRAWYVRGLAKTNSPELKEQAAKFVRDFGDIPASKRDFEDVYNKAK